jgi:hypothetical protein
MWHGLPKPVIMARQQKAVLQLRGGDVGPIQSNTLAKVFCTFASTDAICGALIPRTSMGMDLLRMLSMTLMIVPNDQRKVGTTLPMFGIMWVFMAGIVYSLFAGLREALTWPRLPPCCWPSMGSTCTRLQTRSFAEQTLQWVQVSTYSRRFVDAC